MVNQDVDGHTKTLNHWKIFRKTQKIKNLLETKRILNRNISSVAARFLQFACQVGTIRASASVNYAIGKKCLRGMAYYEWLEKIIFSRK